MEVIGLAIVLIIVVVGGGTLVGSFFNWLGEHNAKREIRKHDEEVARKMRERNTKTVHTAKRVFYHGAEKQVVFFQE